MEMPVFTRDELLVYDYLQKHGPTTMKSVETLLGLTTSTTGRTIRSMLQKGAILEQGQEESSGGRRPALYDVNEQSVWLLGIQISYGMIQVVLCDIKLHILGERKLLMALIDRSPEESISAVADAVCSLLEEHRISAAQVLGAGLGIMGPMHRDTGRTGTLMSYAGPIPAWSGVPIRDMLAQALDIPVYADNSCSAGALAEYFYGDGRGEKSVSFFICDVGILSGQISAGRIVRRLDDREDGFSHTSINGFGELCSCGKRGCVSLYSSATVVRNAIRSRIAHGAVTKLLSRDGEFTFIEYARAARAGDQTVIEVLQEAGAAFGLALSNYINLLTPGYIAIGGAMVSEFSWFYDSAIRTLVHCHGPEITRRIRFKQGGSFGAATVAVGAAAMVYERWVGSSIME